MRLARSIFARLRLAARDGAARRRLLLVAALCSALLLPVAAAAKSRNPARNPGTCTEIARKLVYYDGLKQRAAEAGKDVWVERVEAVIAQTEEEFAAECPEEAAEQRTAQQLAALLKMAGRAALTFFTMGAM